MSRRTAAAAGVLAGLALLLLLAVATPGTGAQSDSRFFPETGHNVRGVFLQYWNQHGGLAQQGYPLTDELQQASPTDGKLYTVQYFERAVFELHPENAGTPYEVLLSLLGRAEYQRKYPDGAPGQQASADNPLLFPETGKTLGGRFRQYWEASGGLAQQGYPISDEFQEVSEQDGKLYTVQYFERAVFEYHPENNAPFDVLLALLGKFDLQRRQSTPTPFETPMPAPSSTPVPTDTPAPADTAGTSCVPPGGPGYSSCAVVDNVAPAQLSVVRVTGVLYRDGQPVAGAIMNSAWHYKTKVSPCDNARTDSHGLAGCSNNIGHATPGFRVQIDVTFIDSGGQFLSSAGTGFTAHQ